MDGEKTVDQWVDIHGNLKWKTLKKIQKKGRVAYNVKVQKKENL